MNVDWKPGALMVPGANRLHWRLSNEPELLNPDTPQMSAICAFEKLLVTAVNGRTTSQRRPPLIVIVGAMRHESCA